MLVSLLAKQRRLGREACAYIHVRRRCCSPVASCRYGQKQPSQTEPNAGTWKTWVISGQQFRVPSPPDSAATDKELTELVGLVTKRDQTSLAQIAYWDTGSPSYRWSEIALTDITKRNMPSSMAMRDLALMHVAIYDAMVAAWDSKYAYNRPHPSAARSDLTTAIPKSAKPIVSRRACGGRRRRLGGAGLYLSGSRGFLPTEGE